MNRLKLTLVALTTTLTFSFAQETEKAKAILDKVSTETKSYKNISAEFELNLDNIAEDIHESRKGTIVLKGDNYYLTLEGTHIIANDEFKWTVLTDAFEVTKEPIGDYADSDEMAPSEIFTMYENGFKYRYVGTEEIDGIECATIELIPTNPDSKSFSRAVIHINTAKNQIKQLWLQGKNGINNTYKILSFKTDTELAGNYFTFRKEICPDCEVLE